MDTISLTVIVVIPFVPHFRLIEPLVPRIVGEKLGKQQTIQAVVCSR
jgi:hypothetical protein